MGRSKISYWSWVRRSGGKEPLGGNMDQLSDEYLQEIKEDGRKKGEKAKEIAKDIKSLCTENELKVVELLEEGFMQSEIAEILDKPSSTINSIVANIRRKAKGLQGGE